MPSKRPKTRQQDGFTLIELIVVMAILLFLSVISYRALVTALDTRQTVSEYSEQLRELELGLFLLVKDLKQVQIAPLPAAEKPFISNIGQGSHSSGTLFRLFRAPDAGMLRGVTPVMYRVENHQLWQIIEYDDNTLRTPLLNRIDTTAVVFYDDNGLSSSVWQQKTPPDVVEITFTHQRYGTLVIKERINAQ